MKQQLLLVFLVACKPAVESSPRAIGSDSVYAELQQEYNIHFHLLSDIFFEDIVEFEKKIDAALRSNAFRAEQRADVRKWQRHARSFISSALLWDCLKYDSGYKRTLIDKEKICSIFLFRLKEMDPARIDLSKSNPDFYHRVINNSYPPTSEAKRQIFFKKLVAQVLAITAESLTHTKHVFPFITTDLHKQCVDLNSQDVIDHDATRLRAERYESIGLAPAPFPIMMRVPKSNVCQELQLGSAQAEKKFKDAQKLADVVNATIERLNADVEKLQELVSPGVDGEAYGLKKNFFIFNATDLENNLVLRAFEDYNATLTESAKQGILPIFFSKIFRKHSGKIDLNPGGRWFGLRGVKYEPLKKITAENAKDAINELREQLLKSWLDLKKREDKVKPEKSATIYKWIINNDIAVAQLILQDPALASEVRSLLVRHRHDPVTPKWLRLAKTWTHRVDIGFIPIAVAVTLLTGGLAGPLMATISVSINFFWIGTTMADTVVARNRYKMLERSIMRGTSGQAGKRTKLLRDFRSRTRDAVVSTGIGAALSIPALKIAIKGTNGMKALAIDLGAAFASDFSGMTREDYDWLGRYNTTTETEQLNSP